MAVYHYVVWIYLFLNCVECLDVKDLFQKAGLKRVKKATSCLVDNGGCDINCEDTPGGAQCSCPIGYVQKSDGRSCQDINECDINNGGCESICLNNHGSYRCNCDNGFKLASDEKTCRDFNECDMNDTCSHICTNTIGSYICSCYEGYIAYAMGRCGDIDECADENGGCHHICENTEGSYRCSCRDGYYLHWNGKDCIKPEKCSKLSDFAQGRLTSSSNKKVWLVDCYHNQSEFRSTKSPSSFSYTCGGASVSREVEAATYPWITRYSHNNTSPERSCGKQLFVLEKTFSLNVKQCGLLVGNAPRVLQSSGRKEYSILSFKVSCGRSSPGKKKAAFFFYVKLLFTYNCATGKNKNKCISKTKRRTVKYVKSIEKQIKRALQRKHLFLRFTGVDISVGKKRGVITGTRCNFGEIEVNNSCEVCGKGTRHDVRTGTCVDCPTGYYQNKVGQLRCIACPKYLMNETRTRDYKDSVDYCLGRCPPGFYSSTGLKPCLPCPENTYQPEYGRLGCYQCGTISRNSVTRAISFGSCSARLRCPSGHYYDTRVSACKRCPSGYYQDQSGKNFCHSCPQGTNTDFDAATSVEFCKSRECGGVIADIQGYIESPNYPGEYPINSICKWNINPPKGRKILLVVPEIHLRSEDNCGDQLVIRKLASSASTLTFDSCQTSYDPKAITARSNTLYIEFKSDGRNTAKGFRIPYVTYDENYESIIKDIVQDSRLIAANYHQDILKNQDSRQTLLDVLASPQNYFALRRQHFKGLFRKAFIHFLEVKVINFLNPSDDS